MAARIEELEDALRVAHANAESLKKHNEYLTDMKNGYDEDRHSERDRANMMTDRVTKLVKVAIMATKSAGLDVSPSNVQRIIDIARGKA